MGSSFPDRSGSMTLALDAVHVMEEESTSSLQRTGFAGR
jgi:hypothetical protein